MPDNRILTGTVEDTPRQLTTPGSTFAAFTFRPDDSCRVDIQGDCRVLIQGELALHVGASIHRGEPVIVAGAVRVDDANVWEIHATHVGHDLRRGQALFAHSTAARRARRDAVSPVPHTTLVGSEHGHLRAVK